MQISLETINACKKEQSNAQRELYDIMLPYLRAVATRYLRNESYVMDVLQESFVKIFKSISSFDNSKSPFKFWAARIVINNSINFNKRIIGNPFTEINELNEDANFTISNLDSFSDEHLLIFLKQMPEKYYNVFNLAVIDGYTHVEIAKFLKISETNSRKKLSRARQWMKDTFTNREELKSYLVAL